MNVLHTADWHLGQKFFHHKRSLEHQAALEWLIDIIKVKEVDILIVAGDIFDTDNPPNYARKLYFNFLKQLVATPCQEVIIIGGNHDSANMLEASKELFELLNIHIIGQIDQDRSKQIIIIKDPKTTEISAVIGAVPYLRDKDIRKSVVGESYEERVERLKEGIQEHYQEIEQALLPYQDLGIPIIVTGHLYAAGGDRGDRPNSIHIGSIDMIEASSFSQHFDYVALGHLHRAQQIAPPRPIWYSGTLIPLDFSEYNYAQEVSLLTFEGRTIKKHEHIQVPLKRKLRHYKGDLEYIKGKLEALETEVMLKTWLKLEVITPSYLPDLSTELDAIIGNKPAEIVVLHQKTAQEQANEQAQYEQLQSLQDLSEMEVFQLYLQQRTITGEEAERLEEDFAELLNWMQEKDEE